MAKIGVLGAGGWGIALSVLLNQNGHEVTLWSKLETEVEEIISTRENKKSLPGIKVDKNIAVTADLDEAVAQKDIIVMAVASVFVRATSALLKGKISENQVIVNVAKGIEEKTLFTISQIIEQELSEANVAVLSGPSHAEEVGKGIPTTVVVGAKDKQTAMMIQNIFSSPVFRVYTSPDILGIELGGSLKNVIALAAGISDGLGYGDNTKAALITRGIHEMSRLGVAMGGKLPTFFGLSGIGDLIVTCSSTHSRNWRAGNLIGQGKTLAEAREEIHMVVEGANSAQAALALAKKYHIVMPIVEQVNAVLFENAKASDAVEQLMGRDKTVENIELLKDVSWDD